MSRGAQKQVVRTRDLPHPNEYVQALLGEYSGWAFDEVGAPSRKGNWRAELGLGEEAALDLEIGTGNGFHFAWRAHQNPDRGLVGIELKYKPLVQTIRRARSQGSTNARMLRYNARLVEDLFAPEELNHVFVHHPDPWPKKSQSKHRLLQLEFLQEVHQLQRPGSFFEFKTDSESYFDWALPILQESPYKIEGLSRDLHNSQYSATNFVTHFESLFLRKGQPIFYALMAKL